VRRIEDAVGRYIEFCKSTFPTHLDLHGMRLVVDSAHGATYHIATHVLHELGADVVAIGNQPDGYNINDACGATHPEALQAAVKREGASSASRSTATETG
jgi:phosphoglucosamine mutase